MKNGFMISYSNNTIKKKRYSAFNNAWLILAEWPEPCPHNCEVFIFFVNYGRHASPFSNVSRPDIPRIL